MDNLEGLNGENASTILATILTISLSVNAFLFRFYNNKIDKVQKEKKEVEQTKDKIQEERIKDAKVLIALGGELKNTLNNTYELIKALKNEKR